jgi:subtilisin family serine protease
MLAAVVGGDPGHTGSCSVLSQMLSAGDVLDRMTVPLGNTLMRNDAMSAAFAGEPPLVELVRVSPSRLQETFEELRRHPDEIEAVEKVPARYACMAGPAHPWNLDTIQWSEARSNSRYIEPQTIKVAVLDTGVDDQHPDMQKVVRYEHTHPVFGPMKDDEKDIVGHGTHVAGTIAAKIHDSGLSGICQCQLMVWKIFGNDTVFGSYNTGFVYRVDPLMYRAALAACEQEDVDVVNLSIGGTEPPDTIELDLFAALLAKNIVVVAAMGNERSSGSPISYPAAIEGVIAVGATDNTDAVASFSNRGAHICVSAPGVQILSTLPHYDGQTGFIAQRSPSGPVRGAAKKRPTMAGEWQGTSMATPHVTAACAILQATAKKNRGRRLTVSQVRTLLQQNADKVPAMLGANFTDDFGAGRLNLNRLV